MLDSQLFFIVSSIEPVCLVLLRLVQVCVDDGELCSRE